MGNESPYRTILLLNRRNKEKITYSVQQGEGMGSGNNRQFLFRWILITLSGIVNVLKVIRAVSPIVEMEAARIELNRIG